MLKKSLTMVWLRSWMSAPQALIALVSAAAMPGWLRPVATTTARWGSPARASAMRMAAPGLARGECAGMNRPAPEDISAIARTTWSVTARRRASSDSAPLRPVSGSRGRSSDDGTDPPA